MERKQIGISLDERISALYDLWYEQKERAISTYTDHLPPRVPLVDNPEFKSVKNAVIKEAMNIISSEKTMEKDKEDVSPDNAPAKVHPTSAGQSPIGNQNNRRLYAFEATTRLLKHISRTLENRINNDVDGKGVDRKLRRKISEKKEAQGLKQ